MLDEFYLSVKSFYDKVNTFGYLELEVEAIAAGDVIIDGWWGASLRNNFLFAAAQVNVVGTITLRQIIDTFTLQQEHPLYNELKGGFPKGYSLLLWSHREAAIPYYKLNKGECIGFSFMLYGHYSEYYTAFTQAIQNMFESGIGNPRVTFHPVHITAKPFVCLSDYRSHKSKVKERYITIEYPVPTNLYNHLTFRQGYYCDRQHEFPSFRQLIHTLAYRVAKLTALYVCPQDKSFYHEVESLISSFTQYAVTPVLVSAQIQRMELNSTPQKRKEERIKFAGYTGFLTFSGNFNYYLPLLLFMQNVGVGNNTTYGLGRYIIVEPEIKANT